MSAVAVGGDKDSPVDPRFAHLHVCVRKKTRSLAFIAVSAIVFALMMAVTWKMMTELRPLPRHHPFFKKHHLETGRSAMLRHASHFADFAPDSTKNATVYKVGIVADMDRVSKIKVAKNSAWMSIFKTLSLVRDHNTGEYSASFLDEIPLVSRLSEADRGMELSELVYFHDKLLSFSDRTGVVYEVTESKLVPLWILSDHDGQSEDGFKVRKKKTHTQKQKEENCLKKTFKV